MNMSELYVGLIENLYLCSAVAMQFLTEEIKGSCLLVEQSVGISFCQDENQEFDHLP